MNEKGIKSSGEEKKVGRVQAFAVQRETESPTAVRELNSHTAPSDAADC